jgi:hypothetical protein
MKITTDMLNTSIREIPLPDNLRERPVTRQGYPVPFFAAKVDGEWDLRVVPPETQFRCMRDRLCWICGQPLGKKLVFVAGPMCVITKTSAEPPCHLSCAEYAAIACPFLAQPRMKRNAVDLPEGHQAPAGIGIMRNPGVTAVLITNKLTPFQDHDGRVLIRMGEPTEPIRWYAQRRRATREEVMESVESGLGRLKQETDNEETQKLRDEAKVELATMIAHFTTHHLPPPGRSTIGGAAPAE